MKLYVTEPFQTERDLELEFNMEAKVGEYSGSTVVLVTAKRKNLDICDTTLLRIYESGDVAIDTVGATFKFKLHIDDKGHLVLKKGTNDV